MPSSILLDTAIFHSKYNFFVKSLDPDNSSYLYEILKFSNSSSNKKLLKMHPHSLSFLNYMCLSSISLRRTSLPLLWIQRSLDQSSTKLSNPQNFPANQTQKYYHNPQKATLKCSGSLLKDYDRTKKVFHEKKKKWKILFHFLFYWKRNRTWIISPSTHIYIWTQSVQVQHRSLPEVPELTQKVISSSPTPSCNSCSTFAHTK